MKKVLLSLAVVAALGMTSCGGVDACSCMEMGMKVSKEIDEAGGDKDKMEAVKKKYEGDMKACEELGKANEKLSEDEQKAMQKDLEDNCPAYKEMMKEIGM
jgi:hypothetical protein